MFEIKVLSKEDIQKIIDMKRVIEGVEKVYSLKSQDDTVVLPTVFYDFEIGKSDMDIKAGLLKSAKLFGHKTVTWFKDNSEKGIPELLGVIVIYDATTGVPLGVLDGSFITGIRTGAAGAIGAKYLAKKDSKILTILGSGTQAANQIAGILSIFHTIEKVIIANITTPENGRKFVENIKDILNDDFNIKSTTVEFKFTEDLKSSVSESDIIITTTPSKKPIILREWINPGTHISCIGADMNGKIELDPLILKDARIFVDDRKQCIEVGEIETAIKNGIIDENNIIGEIGDLIEGKYIGRQSDEDITMFDATGMALLDIMTAKTALDLAEEQNLGSKVEL